MVTDEGEACTLVGNGTAGYAHGEAAVAHFDNPTDVASDGEGVIVVACFFNNRLRKILGEPLTTVGSTEARTKGGGHALQQACCQGDFGREGASAGAVLFY